MKNILVPTDFSTASYNAVDYAAKLAQVLDSELTLINAVVPPALIEDVATAALLMAEAEILEGNKTLMQKNIEELSDHYNIKASGFVREGFPPDIIQDMALAKHAGLIVMGMKGKGKSNSVMGSTTITMIRNASLPVFVIPENAVYKKINTITLASDFDTEIPMDRYTVLKELSEKYNCLIQILNVQKAALAMSAEEVAGKMNTDIVFSKLKHEFYTIEANNIEKGINNFIEKNPTDVLAMMAQKHNFFERVFGKIHTQSMSQQTKIPLLVLQNK